MTDKEIRDVIAKEAEPYFALLDERVMPEGYDENAWSNRKELCREAIMRMLMLRLPEQVIREFISGKLNKSERLNEVFCGSLFWLDEKERERVKAFEQRSGYLVYHVQLTHTRMGDMYAMLYVSPCKDGWEDDFNDLIPVYELEQEGGALCYVENADYPDCSEYGFIGLEARVGGLVRTA